MEITITCDIGKSNISKKSWLFLKHSQPIWWSLRKGPQCNIDGIWSNIKTSSKEIIVCTLQCLTQCTMISLDNLKNTKLPKTCENTWKCLSLVPLPQGWGPWLLGLRHIKWILTRQCLNILGKCLKWLDIWRVLETNYLMSIKFLLS